MAADDRDSLGYAGPRTPPPPDPFDFDEEADGPKSGCAALPCLLVLLVPVAVIVGLVGGAMWAMRGLVLN
jgi:hypothetical protein